MSIFGRRLYIICRYLYVTYHICSTQVLTNYLSDERIVDVYQTSDFRQTFVWRGLCFQSEEERQKYLTILEEKSYQPLDEILRILEADMKKNGKMGASESIESMGFADFGRKLQVHFFPKYVFHIQTDTGGKTSFFRKSTCNIH